jgi:hypothetical protein
MIFYNVVAANFINLTSSHTGLVDENVDITLTCETDEGNPTPNITWKQNNDIIPETEGNELNGSFHALKWRSLLKIKTAKHINGVKYQCFTGSLPPQEYILQVKSKYANLMHPKFNMDQNNNLHLGNNNCFKALLW